MSPRLVLPVLTFAVLAAFAACSEDPTATTTPAGDAGSPRKDARAAQEDEEEEPASDAGTAKDAGKKDASPTSDAGCGRPVVTTPGETCIGFGPKDDPCDPACGQPYGYVCFEGAPPGFASCSLARETSLGQTYCCTKNDCVAQPDLDSMCNGVSGKPHRYQCPPDGDGGHATAPAGCVEKGSGSTPIERFYCCP